MAVPPEPSVEVPAMDGPRCCRARAIVNPWAGRFTRIQPNLRRDATPYGTPASQFEARSRGWTKTPELADGEQTQMNHRRSGASYPGSIISIDCGEICRASKPGASGFEMLSCPINST